MVENYFKDTKTDIYYITPHPLPNGFDWGCQCSWTLTPAESM